MKITSEPDHGQFVVIVRGIDDYGNEITEEVLVPDDGSVVTTKNKFSSACPEWENK